MPVASATVSSASGFYPIVGTPGRVTVTYQYDGSAVIDIVSGDGSGDMLTSIYDIDGNGIVDAAESVPWSGITDAPATFPPDSHEHDLSYAPISHAHVESDITDLGSYSVTGHAHTESDISDFGSYAVTGHAHTESDISDFGSYAVTGHAHTESDISDFGSYAVTGHAHTESDISDFGSYAVVGHTHTESDISDLGAYLTEAAADLLYADISHTHSAPDHGALGGLTDDDHTQYVLLAGRSGGQTVYGGTASGDDLYVYSTSNATKGDIVLASGGGRVGVGQLPDAGVLQVYAGNSGGTPLNANYVPVSIENSTSAYIQLLTPNTAVSGITFSDPEDWDNGYISYNHSTQVMTLAADGVDTMHLTDGYVGIGTASPSYALDVAGVVNISGDQLLFSGGSGLGSDPPTAVATLYNRAGLGPTFSGYQVAFRTGATPAEALRIDPSGNVGIGTTSPLNRLHVYDAVSQPVIRLEGQLSGGTHEPTIYMHDNRGTGYAAVSIRGSRNISSGGHSLVFSTTADNAAEVAGTLTDRLWIDRGGNVGIGTNAPQAKLHVVGGIMVDGDSAGYSGAVTFTDQTQGVSSGTGTIKVNGTTARNSTGWLKIMVGTTAMYVPYFQTITG